MYPLIIMEAISQKSRRQKYGFLLEAPRENSFHASCSFWWLLAIPGVPFLADASLQFLPPSSHHLLLLCFLPFLSLIRTLLIGFTVHPHPGWSPLKILNYICKDFFPNKVRCTYFLFFLAAAGLQGVSLFSPLWAHSGNQKKKERKTGNMLEYSLSEKQQARDLRGEVYRV